MIITLTNATPFIFILDKSARCCSKCNQHCGFSAESGKFVQGHVPPIEIRPNTSIDIHVSGRESSAVVPDGWIQYNIHDPSGNATPCKFKVNYSGAGWSSFQNKTVVECIFVGIPPIDGGSGGKLTRRVEEHGARSYRVHFEIDGRNQVKAGEDPVNWEQMVCAVFRPGSASRCSGLRVLITDQTPSAKGSNRGLTVAWWVGAAFGAFDVVARARDDDGFQSAIAKVASELARRGAGAVVGELQFWCHGGPGGRVVCGDTCMPAAALAPLRPFARPHSRVWFRTCSTAADSDDLKGCSPGPVATAWAEDVRRAGGFGVVAAHTVPIGNGRHSSLYAYNAAHGGPGPGEWLGPQADEGRPDEALHHYFPALP